MKKIIWNDKTFDFGDRILNLQNQHVADLLNMIHQSPSLLSDRDFITSALEELFEYSQECLGHEEDILTEISCQYTQEHKQRNWEFLTNLSTLSAMAENGSLVFPTKFEEFVEDWWENHVIREDLKCRTCISTGKRGKCSFPQKNN
ncbi:hemerythrin family protein [Terasakiella sp. SH-1]|uniref:bacteriohemerythrin n=1 Tax=Terasakiella sp. SH-1 TaxID=2560057 RepID=UPI0010745CDD|nr:hemerythrin family protein [Terasakiella sp. SH-1]